MVAVRTGLVNPRGVVSGIHDVVQIGDALGARFHQGTRYRGVVNAGGGEQSADRDLAIGDT